MPIDRSRLRAFEQELTELCKKHNLIIEGLGRVEELPSSFLGYHVGHLDLLYSVFDTTLTLKEAKQS